MRLSFVALTAAVGTVAVGTVRAQGVWEAATARLSNGWSVEIRIPVQTLAFKRGLHEWHFNVQRRIL